MEKRTVLGLFSGLGRDGPNVRCVRLLSGIVREVPTAGCGREYAAAVTEKAKGKNVLLC